MKNELDKCNLCPRKCLVNRNKGQLGYCKVGNSLKIALYSLHMWEEPCISGKEGSGTIFFSSCNLKCLYCQNYKISKEAKGYEISIEQFSDICLNLQEKGALNINLVTPTSYVPLIIEGISLAKSKGLKIPIVYNTSSYEQVKTIKMLDKTVDVFLADLKYYDDTLAQKYSNCQNYFKYATLAIKQMYKQVGSVKLDNKGHIKKGLIVRHLVLPGHIEDSKKILKYLYDTYHDNIYISIMSQYTPINKCKYSNLNRKLTKYEYEQIIDYAYDLGITKAYVQDEDSASSCFIPDF